MNRSTFTRQALSTFHTIQAGRNNIDLGFHFNAHEVSDFGLCGITLALFDKLNLIQFLNLAELELMEFIVDVRDGYLSNPYHSFQHAVDVCVFLFYSLTELNLSQFLSKEDILTLMISGLCHDIGHPGVNNTYQINTHTELAKLYDNVSVLENHSITLTLNLLQQHQLLTRIDTKSTLKYLESRIVNEILATDMAFHFSLQAELSELLTCWSFESKVPKGPVEDDESRLKLCKFIIHAADISNAVRPWHLCKLWSDRVVSEFFLQGDLEKQHNLTVSNNMDRDTTTQHQIALDFDKFIVKPFFEILAKFIPKTHLFLFHLTNNRHHWEFIKQSHSRHTLEFPTGYRQFHRRVSFSAGTVTLPNTTTSLTSKKPYHTLKHKSSSFLTWVRHSHHSHPPLLIHDGGAPPDKRSLQLLFSAN